MAPNDSAANVGIDGTVHLPEKHQHGSAAPKLERHYSHISPDSDNEDLDPSAPPKSSSKVKEKLHKLKDHLKPSSSSSGQEGVPSHPQSTTNDKRSSSSGLEVSPMLSIDSNSSSESKDDRGRPDLERHVTEIGQDGEEPKPKQTRGGMSKLERKISSIPQDDYASDDEGRL